MEDEIKYGDWAYLKSNPEIIIRVEIINPNGIVDFRRQREEEPYYAYLDELVKITDKTLTDELDSAY